LRKNVKVVGEGADQCLDLHVSDAEEKEVSL
jgi:hypothetical protein